ncbi:MAG: hypothetical protein FWG67_06955 [Defluviitaleaceae bacterium]|nr:hypothetical protein [Defluviitaleaceae bacterium]
MVTIIQPRDFLMRLKNDASSELAIRPSDLLLLPELAVTIPLSKALDEAAFYRTLKKAVSEFNSDAALNDRLFLDFDDLHTKYSEYAEVLKPLLREAE